MKNTLLISILLISLNASAQDKPAQPAPVNPAIAAAKAKFESDRFPFAKCTQAFYEIKKAFRRVKFWMIGR